jgi:hypothetical protein
MDEQRLFSFIHSLRTIDGFSHAGEPCEKVRVVDGIQSGWDREGKRMLEVWEPRIRALEAQAESALGHQGVDRIFLTVSDAIHESLYKQLCSYLDRVYAETADGTKRKQRTVDESLLPEVMDSVKRDVCWAAVENMVRANGFFSNLLEIYRTGRWPCSWDGEYPQGLPAIL